MFLTWAIIYLDRTDENRRSRERQFQDRHVYLDTGTLDPATRAAVELLIESRTSKTEREILKFRHLFQELDEKQLQAAFASRNQFSSVVLDNYVEDETGKELSSREVAELVTGSPTAILVPSGFQQHDVEFMLSEPKQLPVAEVTLSSDDVKDFAIFTKDYREFANSAFMQDGPGTLKTTATCTGEMVGDPVLETATTDAEIRSFVTVFRRLYMTGEPANFMKVAELFEKAVASHALGKWVKGVSQSYDNEMKRTVDARPFAKKGDLTFSRKRLIDVFLYTEYAHQPDAKRLRQFGECLAELNGHKPVLTWLFFTEMWKSSLQIKCGGKVIAGWFDRYCQHHGVSHDIHPSVAEANPGIGAQEKEADRKARLLREKTEQLATEIWKAKGGPAGGPAQFFDQAKEQLNKALGD